MGLLETSLLAAGLFVAVLLSLTPVGSWLFGDNLVGRFLFARA